MEITNHNQETMIHEIAHHLAQQIYFIIHYLAKFIVHDLWDTVKHMVRLISSYIQLGISNFTIVRCQYLVPRYLFKDQAKDRHTKMTCAGSGPNLPTVGRREQRICHSPTSDVNHKVANAQIRIMKWGQLQIWIMKWGQ